MHYVTMILIGGGFIGIVNNINVFKMILLVTMLTLPLGNNVL